ncbi:putative hydrolase of the HAD superfamily [Catenuloplanes nepalensis]|uniref:Hydrolase of the HAD superfamily n=1 Tax=Catenuloplanes nepalensis TaxID=587533 RepID=A0ABT9N4Z7_9ACTN|nr:HAD family hydrolase [Catenuloplanes nepalensis]MDP9798779.1 putative hydrolase of the HAD superfamily [Catenuloplanes nepalensis]
MQPTRILFDFFGTLVDYSSSRTAQGYPKTWATVRDWGVEVSYERMLAEWSATCLELDRICEAGHREYSMLEAAAHFLPKILGRRSTAAQGEEFVHAYLDEWNAGVTYPPGIQAFVRTLAQRYQLAVVTNTHWAGLVPQHLITMGLADAFAEVITSVELGRRKPHPQTYATALAALQAAPEDAVFVGDTFEPDFLGPEAAGIRAYLIDPRGHAPIPADRRLTTVFDLTQKL